ncbi:MAG: hypothetical protein COA43_08525 [Robiginitomaculum sp.]|nr:MAG: hypothetical protein COA43_08525 [Robiginitomaculum sp.]
MTLQVLSRSVCLTILLGTTGCATTLIPKSYLNTIHFPRFTGAEDRIVVPGSIKGRLIIQDNCIFIVRKNRKILLVWRPKTELSLKDNKIVLSHPDFQNLVVGKKYKLHGTRMGAIYNPANLILQNTVPQKCEQATYMEVLRW